MFDGASSLVFVLPKVSVFWTHTRRFFPAQDTNFSTVLRTSRSSHGHGEDGRFRREPGPLMNSRSRLVLDFTFFTTPHHITKTIISLHRMSLTLLHIIHWTLLRLETGTSYALRVPLLIPNYLLVAVTKMVRSSLSTSLLYHRLVSHPWYPIHGHPLVVVLSWSSARGRPFMVVLMQSSSCGRPLVAVPSRDPSRGKTKLFYIISARASATEARTPQHASPGVVHPLGYSCQVSHASRCGRQIT